MSIKHLITTMAAILATAALASACHETPAPERVIDPRLDHCYAKTGIVISVSDAGITIRDKAGRDWTFRDAVEDWLVGDIASCIMYDRLTESVLDDEILSVRYDGWVW